MKYLLSLLSFCFISIGFINAQIGLPGGDEEVVFPFERTYPAADESHITLDLDTVGGSFITLAAERNRDEEIRRMNVTSFDAKGNINWTQAFEYKRDLDLLPIGDITVLGDDSIAFTAVLDTMALQKVITKIGADGGYGWSKIVTTQDQADEAFTGRSELTSIGRASMLSIYKYSDDIVATVLDLEGTILNSKSINASSTANSSDEIIDAFSTIDSSVLMVSNNASQIVVTKMDTTGSVLWMKAYESPLDNTISVEATNMTELANGIIAISGKVNIAGGTSENLVLTLSGLGEVITGYVVSSPLEQLSILDIGGSPDTTVLFQGFKDVTGGEVEPYIAQLKLDSTLGWNTFSFRSIEKELNGFAATKDGGAIMYMSGGTRQIADRETPYLIRYDNAGKRNGVCAIQNMELVLGFTDIIVSDVEYTERALTGLTDTISVVDVEYMGFNPPILSLADTTYCPQDPINFELDATVEGGLGYFWSENVKRPAEIVIATEAGEYSVTVTARGRDGITCFTLCDTTNINQKELPMVMLEPNLDQYCETGRLLLGVSSNNPIVEIDWSTGVSGETRIGVTEPGNYRVTVVDDCGNSGQASLSLGEADFDIDLPVDIATDDTYCTNGSIRLRLVDYQGSPNDVTWSTGESGVTQISVTEPGSYGVVVEGRCGGMANVDVSSNLFLDPGTIEISQNCGTNNVTLIATDDNIASRLWSNGATSASIQVTEPGTYSVVGTDLCGDQVTADIEVSQSDLEDCGVEPPSNTGMACMEFPNAFVPNSIDEVNRTFAPRNDCADVNDYELNIYNRWGAKIFSSDRIDVGWDGRKSGKEAPADVYFFYSSYNPGDGMVEEKGDLMLIR